jgi:hypothetical protein
MIAQSDGCWQSSTHWPIGIGPSVSVSPVEVSVASVLPDSLELSSFVAVPSLVLDSLLVCVASLLPALASVSPPDEPDSLVEVELSLVLATSSPSPGGSPHPSASRHVRATIERDDEARECTPNRTKDQLVPRLRANVSPPSLACSPVRARLGAG